MIRTLTVSTDGQINVNIPIQDCKKQNVTWYWVDFVDPSKEEIKQLEEFFNFHPLAIEDCIHLLQRPKLDFYEEYQFFVLHAIDQKTLEPLEVDLFLNENMIVTFHYKDLDEVNRVWKKFESNRLKKKKGPYDVMYQIFDNIVDAYFPPIYQIEDALNRLEDIKQFSSLNDKMDDVFEIRSDLSQMRRTIIPTRDLLYRTINSDRLTQVKLNKAYFTDIHDHLLKLSDMIETNRDVSSDIRDSFMALSSNRMNNIMMTLTIFATIFMPLTFIVGIYGMNFTYMPELNWKYGYFIILGLMMIVIVGMVGYFKKKGWF